MDNSGTVLGWHLFLDREALSVWTVLPSGRGFYPDFIVGVRDRPRRDQVLLAGPKEGMGPWEQADLAFHGR